MWTSKNRRPYERPELIIALSAALLLAACRGTMVDCDKHDSMHPECRRSSCIAVPGNVCQR